ncbi:hypothetical protein ACHQM5_022801 [Ranunculus cassubicifolius]
MTNINNIDSPISRRIVLSFLDFLKSVEPSPGVDVEGLEVVRDCLQDVFKINSASTDEKVEPGLLVKYFSSLDSSEQHQSSSGNATRFSDPPSTSTAGSGESDTSGVSEDELFGQFCAALDKSKFFSNTTEGGDEHQQMDRATHLFHEALKELKSSGSKTINCLNLADTFKSQGNKAMQSKLYPDAIELYTYAIALCGRNAVYYCNRAAAFTQMNKNTEAITDCKKSIEIDPNYSKAYSRLGLAYYAQGQYRDAIEKGFSKALQLDPNNDSIKENIRVAEQKLMQNQRSGVPPQFGDFQSGIASMFMNMVGGGQTPTRDPTRETSMDDIDVSEPEPEIEIGGNISMNINGQEVDVPDEFMGTWQSVMGMFPGLQPHGGTQRGPNQN